MRPPALRFLHDAFFLQPLPQRSADLLALTNAVPLLQRLQAGIKFRVDAKVVESFRRHESTHCKDDSLWCQAAEPLTLLAMVSRIVYVP